jgi:hypothetical protein
MPAPRRSPDPGEHEPVARGQADQERPVIAGLNNANALKVQQLVNDGNLATIKANGEINVKITDLQNTNKLLLQTSAAASSIYGTVLANMANVMNNKDLTEDQKTTELNNLVSGLNDALNVIGKIANNQSTTSTLNFSGGTNAGGGATTPPAPVVTPPVTPTGYTGPPAATTPARENGPGYYDPDGNFHPIEQ